VLRQQVRGTTAFSRPTTLPEAPGRAYNRGVRLVAIGALALLLIGASLGATPLVLRMASIAPSGTRWETALKRFGHQAEQRSEGEVQLKWYMGGVAGDELTTLGRMQRGGLDGVAGAIFCEQLAPSLRVMEVIGMVQSTDEADHILEFLQPDIEQDFRTTPFVALATATGFGHRVLFSRRPVRSLEDLRAGRYWVWSLDEVLRAQLVQMGVPIVPLPVEQAAHAYDEGRVDGFITIPYSVLAFRFSAQARYFTDLESAFLPGCLVMARRALATLSPTARAALAAAAPSLKLEFERLGRDTEESLLHGVFQHHGLEAVPMSSDFRRAFLEAGRQASAALGARLVSPGLVARVAAELERFRAERRRHPAPSK
jgi:TRAP-type C4-dicarboxylate transport system substrate-binding protein